MFRNLLFSKPKVVESDIYYQALKAYQIDPDQDFVRVKNRIGLECAYSYAQLYFAGTMGMKRFRRELELHNKEYNQLNSQYDIIVVEPPTHFLRKQLVQKTVRQYSILARSAGFGMVSPSHLDADNAIDGGRRLFKLIDEKRKNGRKVILISFSYGSAFVRVMLDHMESHDVDTIKGWLNISGLIFGSPRFHCSDKKSFFGVSKALRSFSSEQRYFVAPFDPKGIKVVHALGFNAFQNLSRTEVRAREYLRAWGPNDGLIPFADYQKLTGPVLTAPGQNHLIDVSSMASTFVRSLSSMVSTIPIDNRDFKNLVSTIKII